ncbi:copper resistance protein CopC [Isoptericola halotolerans]|uniref:copper resistance CopC family protein n=1 Tax=Isoptericola halotolerans TaxID=300560 RepID=UPI00388CF045
MAQTPEGSRPDSRPSGRRPSASGPDWTPVRKNRGRVVAAIVALAMLLTAVGGTAVSILGASSAGAHDQLVSSDPADGDELDAPVGEVTLTYSAEIIADGTQVRLATPDGDVDADVAIEGEQVTATFDTPDAGGEYRVQWRVVSSDGHPIEGELAYEVAAPAAPSPEESGPTDEPGEAASAEAELEESGEAQGLGAAPEPSPSATEPVGDEGADGSTGAMPLVYGAALVALIGVAAMTVLRSRRRLHETTGQEPRDGPQA